MNKKILNKLVKLLETKETKIDMAGFVPSFELRNPQVYKEKVHCGTSCCLAGYIPLVAPDYAEGFVEDSNGEYNFFAMSYSLVGSWIEWNFLFRSHHSNDIDKAILRLKAYIKDPTVVSSSKSMFEVDYDKLREVVDNE